MRGAGSWNRHFGMPHGETRDVVPPSRMWRRCSAPSIVLVDAWCHHYSEESTVCARSLCMRISTADCRPNAPLMTSARSHVAMQSSANDLICTLRPWLPVRSFRHLPVPWRRQGHRARRMRSSRAQYRSNAPGIALARPRVARQCLGRVGHADALHYAV